MDLNQAKSILIEKKKKNTVNDRLVKFIQSIYEYSTKIKHKDNDYLVYDVELFKTLMGVAKWSLSGLYVLCNQETLMISGGQFGGGLPDSKMLESLRMIEVMITSSAKKKRL